MAVVGAGTLGRRIALMLSLQGADVRIHARTAASRDAAVAYALAKQPEVLPGVRHGRAGRIVAVDDLAAALEGAWLVVESIPEDLSLKREMFRKLDALAPADAILATNSSSFASRDLVASVAQPQRLLNAHFFMPPVVVPVELMSCGQTDPAVIALLAQRLPAYGLSPYVVQTESMGFIYNRIWAAVKRETLLALADGVATPQALDALYCEATGQRHGPCRIMDAVGLDVVLAIEEHYASVREALPEAPRRLLETMISEGRLGRKSGRGFYDYNSSSKLR